LRLSRPCSCPPCRRPPQASPRTSSSRPTGPSRSRFETPTPGFTLGEPRLPKGKIKDDEFFGRVEIFRQRLEVRIPVRRDPGAGRTLELVAHSQGCADVGVCYPPQRQVALLSLPAAAAAPPPAAKTADRAPGDGPLAALSRLARSLGGDAGDGFLPPEEAFRLSVRAAGPGLVEARWEIAEGYYLYRDKLGFAPAAEGVRVGEPRLPPPKEKEDPFFGRVQVYYGTLVATVPVEAPDGEAALEITYQGCAVATVPVEAPDGEAALEITYQGCAEAGLCYPPMTKTVTVAVPAGPPPALPAPAPAGPAQAPEPVSEQDRLARFLLERPLWVSAGLFFVLGLGLAFTPCVFPMFPILSSIVVGQGRQLTTAWAFTLSLTYVLAMAVTYTVHVRLLRAADAERDPGPAHEAGQQPARRTPRRRGDHGLSVRPHRGALRDGAAGGGPAGDRPDGRLPKAGPWMNAVKAVFGVLLLAVGLWLLERVIPVWTAMLLWAALLIVSAVYMGALDPVPAGASGWRRLWKGLGWVPLLWGALLLVGMAAGVRDTLQPLHGLLAPARAPAGAAVGEAAGPAAEGLAFAQVKGIEQVEQAVAAAAREGRPTMLDFYADWCISCKELEKLTFSDPGVRAELEGFQLLQVDMTPWDEQDKALAKRYGVVGPPVIMFFGPDGRERKAFRIVGFVDADEFRAHVRRFKEAVGYAGPGGEG